MTIEQIRRLACDCSGPEFHQTGKSACAISILLNQVGCAEGVNERRESSGITPERSEKITLSNQVSDPDQAIQQAREKLKAATLEWGGEPYDEAVGPSVDALLAASRASLEEEIKVTEHLAAMYKSVLDEIPECPAHGSCVPHAIDWIRKRLGEAALQSRASQDWQDISTAPKDGTWILVQTRQSCQTEYAGPVYCTRWATDGWLNINEWCSPKFWMPIPPSIKETT